MLDFLDEFDKSLARVTARDRGRPFFQRFYDKFTASDPEVAAKFAKTVMERQQEMLRESLAEMRIFFEEHTATPYVAMLARIHSRAGRDIEPRFYDLWLDSLVETVEEFDPEFSHEVRVTWRVIMAPGIEFMRLAYAT